MTVEGHIVDGQVVLAGPLAFPNGTVVEVSVPANEERSATEDNLPTLYERMKSVAGKAEGLPSDLAINHDHYLHGQPKRQ